MLKTYIWGFCGLEGKFILDELRRHINVVDWISDQEGAHNIWDFLMPDAMLCYGLYPYAASARSLMKTLKSLMLLALLAYATYVVNAGQFLWKLRMARLDSARPAAAFAAAGALAE